MMFLLATAFATDVMVLASDELPPYQEPIRGFIEVLGRSPRIAQIQGREVVAEVEADAIAKADPEVVFALGAKAAYALKQRIPGTTMVVVSVRDPERFGIMGPQIAGVNGVIPPETYLTQLRAFFPQVNRLGVVRAPGEDTSDLERAARTVGVQLTVERVGSPKVLRKVVQQLAKDNDAVWLSPNRDYLSPQGFRSAVDELRRRKKPLVTDSLSLVEAGAAFGVVPDLVAVGRQAAMITKRLLDGESAEAIGMEDPQTLSTAVNVKALREGEVPFEELMLDFAQTVY